jgi:hypothetical protein
MADDDETSADVTSTPNVHCPVCGTGSELVIGATQALCTNDETCRVIFFNPSLPDGGLSNPSVLDLSGTGLDGEKSLSADPEDEPQTCDVHGAMAPRSGTDLSEVERRSGRWYDCPVDGCGCVTFVPSERFRQWFFDPTAPESLHDALMAEPVAKDCS